MSLNNAFRNPESRMARRSILNSNQYHEGLLHRRVDNELAVEMPEVMHRDWRIERAIECWLNNNNLGWAAYRRTRIAA